jgi:hypothetical protein
MAAGGGCPAGARHDTHRNIQLLSEYSQKGNGKESSVLTMVTALEEATHPSKAKLFTVVSLKTYTRQNMVSAVKFPVYLFTQRPKKA